jgi:hypothetical protein
MIPTPRVVVALHDVERIVGDVLARHEPLGAGVVRVPVRLESVQQVKGCAARR